VVAVVKTVSFALMELETPVAVVEVEVKVVQEAKVDGAEVPLSVYMLLIMERMVFLTTAMSF
jgi:hypothetical protein